MIPELIFGHLYVRRTPNRVHDVGLALTGSLTSSNYDDDQKKLTGGRNGYGAKLANIYSLEFSKFCSFDDLLGPECSVVETADKTNGKKYKQVFSENMGKKGTPKASSRSHHTSVAHRPRSPKTRRRRSGPKSPSRRILKRFGMTGIDDDTYALLCKRVYDIAGTVKDIKVSLNDERLKIKGFKQVNREGRS